ncbi:uncharacterized protein [Halyomorpha halys]|uniref:uncharacterized protein n=1 Tax=Halyomorpha halys TaxID=286706 RepID=UPI0006D4E28F|nr:uncharacterized protein LOC106680532 [Halyomorpha halys]
MYSYRFVFLVVCFITTFDWSTEYPTDVRLMRMMSEPNPEDLGNPFVLSGPSQAGFWNSDRKRRTRRHADDAPLTDPEAFLKLLELAKAVSGANPSGGISSKFRSLDADSFAPPSSPRRLTKARKGSDRRNIEQDYMDEAKPEWRKQNYEDSWSPKTRNLENNHDDTYQNYWQGRQSR